MHRAALALLAAALLGGSAQAPASPETSVDKLFDEYDKPGTPGCAVGVVRAAKMIHARGYGLANLEYDIPLTSTTVFDIGSTSKQFTAAAILLLEQQGRLSIDDRVRKFVPELPAYADPVTVRHLLNHTGGLRDYLTLMSVAGVRFDGVTTEEDALETIVRQRALNFAPGGEYLYSNTGYFLLSVVVKRVAGKSLREFAHEEIFAPLGMRDTHFHDDHTMIVPRRAAAYSPRPGGGFRIDMSGFEQTGDGAVYTTVEDLAKWDRNFYDPKVGGQRLIDSLLEKAVLTDGQTLDYAAGLVNGSYKGLPAVSHGGSWAGYRADLIRFPAQAFSVIVLCNRGDANPSMKARQVADLYLSAEFTDGAPARAGAPPAAAVPSEQLGRLVGIYRNAMIGTVRRIEMSGGRLRAGQQDLIPLGDDRFAVESAPEVILVFAGRADAQRLTVSRPGSPAETLEQVHPPVLTPAQLAAFAGSYYSEELDTAATLAVEDGGLRYHGPIDPPRQLEPLSTDLFVSGSWQFEITRDRASNVAGFLLHAGRIRGLRFVKR